MTTVVVEFVQNLLMVGAWCGALWMWVKWRDRRSRILAIMLLVLAFTAAPLFIGGTEYLKTGFIEGSDQSRHIINNMVIFVSIALLTLFYFAASWSSWKSDLVVGVVVGIAQSVVQAMSLSASPVRLIWHGIAMMVGITVMMVGIRFALSRAQTWWRLFGLCVIATLVGSICIAILDYGIGGVLASRY